MILIVSKDEDFSSVVAEQIERELALSCQKTNSLDEALARIHSGTKLLITTEEIEKKPEIPVLFCAKSAPIRLQDLLANVRDLLHKPATGETLALGGNMAFLPLQKQLVSGNKTTSLTDKEAQLLNHFIAARGKVVAKETLLKEVWGIETEMDTHTLETHIYRLRAKMRELGDEPAIIAAEGGYALEVK